MFNCNIKTNSFMVACVIVFVFNAFSLVKAAPVHAELIDRIVAVVNNDVITLVELNNALRPYIFKLDSSGYSPEKKREILSQLAKDMLNRMVERKLTDQEAKRVKITVSDKEVDSAIERLKESQLMSQEELEKALKEDGLTFADYREKIREEILRPKLINQSVKSKVVITEKDIKDYYEKHNNDFAGKRKYYLRNILIRSESDIASGEESNEPTSDVASDSKKRAEQIKQRLDSGEDFQAVAKAESEAPNAQEGGDLGLFDWETLSDTIKNAVENLKPGQHTSIIVTDQGYQIFYVENIENQSLTPLNEVSEAISKKLYDEIVQNKFRDWLEALKEKSHIKTML